MVYRITKAALTLSDSDGFPGHKLGTGGSRHLLGRLCSKIVGPEHVLSPC